MPGDEGAGVLAAATAGRKALIREMRMLCDSPRSPISTSMRLFSVAGEMVFSLVSAALAAASSGSAIVNSAFTACCKRRCKLSNKTHSKRRRAITEVIWTFFSSTPTVLAMAP